jgi:hypothetical protein
LWQWKADDRAGARQTLGEAMAIADKEAGIPSRAKTAASLMYHSIANGLDAAGNATDALPLVQRIQGFVDQEEDLHEKILMLRELVYTQVAAGQYFAALRTVETMPAGNERDAFLQAVATARMNHGDVDGGLATAETISSESWRFASLQCAAEKLAASHRFDQALSVLDTIPKAQDRALALASLGMQQAGRGDHAAAFTVQKAWDTAQEAKPEVGHRVFEFLAIARGSLGDFSSALAMVERLDAESRVWPLSSLTNMMVAAGRKEEALALARSQESAHPKVYAFMGIARAMLAQRDAARKSTGNK